MIKLLIDVNRVYTYRKKEILDLWKDVCKKTGEMPLSTLTTKIDEVDIYVDGFVTRQKAIISRIEELENEYQSINDTFMQMGTWHKLFSFLPFLKTNKATRELALEFIEKWEKYIPGWS